MPLPTARRPPPLPSPAGALKSAGTAQEGGRTPSPSGRLQVTSDPTGHRSSKTQRKPIRFAGWVTFCSSPNHFPSGFNTGFKGPARKWPLHVFCLKGQRETKRQKRLRHIFSNITRPHLDHDFLHGTSPLGQSPFSVY